MAKKSITLTLEEDVVAQLDQFVAMDNFANRAQAVNAIVRAYFAATPEHGFDRAAQERALTEARIWVFTRVNNFFKEIQAVLNASRS